MRISYVVLNALENISRNKNENEKKRKKQAQHLSSQMYIVQFTIHSSQISHLISTNIRAHFLWTKHWNIHTHKQTATKNELNVKK